MSDPITACQPHEPAATDWYLAYTKPRKMCIRDRPSAGSVSDVFAHGLLRAKAFEGDPV